MELELDVLHEFSRMCPLLRTEWTDGTHSCLLGTQRADKGPERLD